ncbi:hypothetical protein IWX50DRAFT_22905 [Phyllosticta citricarpa]|uniref:BHLH domain-containing protein n=1 Tax=Phyllosticta citricarpa TaxID=55181 RepID=A0ABR1LJZ1_9PEZI
MPRPALPPTPAASTDITGKPADPGLAHDPSWTLPPAALAANSHAAERSNSRRSVSSSSVASCNASDSSYHPTSPVTHSSPTTRKRPVANNGAPSAKDDDYNLPPPPTRLRKIIQMKPKSPEDENERTSTSQDAAAPSTSPGTSKDKAKNASSAGGNGRGKKNGNGSTAAGRKIARKTAHSLIERRRRSKMNEEFGTLKDMIPACAGQEMHKLAILQASIEYMRYLEHCVAELKAANRSKQNMPESGVSQSESNHPTLNPAKPPQEDFDDTLSEDNEEEQDEEMSDISPSRTPNAPFTQPMHPTHGSHSTTTSPSIDPVDSGDRPTFSATTSPAIWPTPSNASISGSSRRPSSIITSPAMYGAQGAHQNYVFSTTGSHSNNASPSILPSPGAMAISGERNLSFSLTSPALGPQPDSREDHEATAALLMLNSDRRRWDGRGPDAAARGAVQEARAPMRGKMSVRDLLSG